MKSDIHSYLSNLKNSLTTKTRRQLIKKLNPTFIYDKLRLNIQIFSCKNK